MKKSRIILICLCIFFLSFALYLSVTEQKSSQPINQVNTNTAKENTTNQSTIITPNNVPNEKIKVANWNLQIFGDSKASKPELMSFYADTLKDYDIAFVQEIRDIDGSSFVKLCSMLQDYNCNVSSRAGRSSSKEQYGVIYKKGITIKRLKDFNPDNQDRWERPPIEVTFDIGNYELNVYNIHTKPEDVKNELFNLESIVSNQGNVLIIGDLNADCNYYNHATSSDFKDWNWVINDEQDTTSGNTVCAYDRIILNSDSYKEYSSYGIFSKGITSNVSDHYLVWVELKTS